MLEQNNEVWRGIHQVSVVIPLYNEEENLRELHHRLKKIFKENQLNYEIIFVDDGSQDNSLAVIKEICRSDTKCRYVSFSRNFGHEAASTAGLERARGEVAILMDADLQDPPEFIPTLIKKWQEGYEVVYARRKKRRGESLFKQITSWLFYRLLNLFSEIKIPEDVGDFRLMDRKILEEFKKLPERNRFVRGLIAWLGYRQTSVEYERPERYKGKTKYNPFQLTYLAFDALTSFSTSLLRISTFSGFIVAFVSFLIVLIIFCQKVFFRLPIPGYALIATGLFFLGGLILIYLGLVGEYIAKIHRQVQERPLYIVKEEKDGEDSL